MEILPSIVLNLIGIAGFGIVVIKSTRELLTYIQIRKSGHLVKGKIIGFEEDTSGDGVGYPAILSYTTILGEKITTTSKTSSGVKPSIGKEVWIIYSPANPSHFYYQRSIVPFLMVAFILAFGFALLYSIVNLYKSIYPASAPIQ